MSNILKEADNLTAGDRNQDYGTPLDDFTRTAKIWTEILGCAVKPTDVPLCMIALKISRQCHKPGRDNLVDIAGYARTIEMCEDSAIKDVLGDHDTETFGGTKL